MNRKSEHMIQDKKDESQSKRFAENDETGKIWSPPQVWHEGLRHSVRLESPTAVGFLGLDPFLKTNAAPKPSRSH
ncbi:hypothetical protein V6N13_128020 [Hibiscus sabdariffa]|uniref:Uncharacterized protein n=1 Tax=Hibiscus sabdariffa TaxID=183260 RepID=A0ABR2CEF9_9ROSI